ncbi:MAG: hypothetical protein GY868_10955, partial [Deltaproteobacteria bacterium]|nr:hypothetical protein [Deltaproteobacteria bacterium]
MLRLGWFATGRGQGSMNLLHAIVGAIKDGSVKAEISYVFCSREPGDAEGSDRFIKQVQDYGINLVCFSSKRFKPELRKAGKQDPALLTRWRLEYDREIMRCVDPLGADLGVLAGYMLVLGGEMCAKYDIVNLHPASPGGPAGTWQEVIWQLIDERAEESGNMMHLVIEALDQGPPITYGTFPVRGPGFDELWQELDEQLKTTSLADIQKEQGEENPLFARIRKNGALREVPL